MRTAASAGVVEQFDLFVTYLTDLPLRDQRDTMERPFFSLAKSRAAPIVYDHNGVFVRVTAPSEFGIATIWDLDVLIWAASQITDARNNGRPHSPRIGFMPYDLLRAIRRGTSGKDYAALRAALRRLTATSVETNVRVPEGQRAAMFHWVERWAEETDAAGNSRGMSIEFPAWLYNAIAEGRVLGISPDYFAITSGLGRWLYRVVRKHAGNQEAGWSFTMRTLFAKSGSTQRFSDFARDLRRVVAADALPEYHLTAYEGARGDDCVHAIRRTLLPAGHPAVDRELVQELGLRRTYPKRLRPAPAQGQGGLLGSSLDG